MHDALLEIKNLAIRFQQDKETFIALNNISLSIAQGETLALVGESGSGKTLTGLAILQILPVNAQINRSSQILLAGNDLCALPEIALRKIRGRRIGIIFQEAINALNPVLTIGEQIDEALKHHFRMSNNLRKTRILELLDEVGIPDPQRCAKSYIHTLSGGMRQRAMIAMALAPKPDLLIADEPTTALDVTLQAQILKLLRDIQRQNNMALLFITHDLGIVWQIADRVAVISKGHIVEQQTVEDFFRHPEHPYSRKLFAALPTWEKRTTTPSILQPHDINAQKQLLTVSDLKIHFPIRRGILRRTVDYVKAVDGVSFSIKPGQTFALVGESGCGKTTIAKGILRLVKPNHGKILFNDQDLATISLHKMRYLRGDLQMIFQDPYSSMNPRMRVSEILTEGMLTQKIAANFDECMTKIDELLHLVDLPLTVKNRFPHEFSGGQRQRICIARALAMQPKLIICDEPTSALDVIVQMEILQLLQRLQQELGLSYLLITHNMSVVAYLADQVAVMQRGCLVEQGDAKQVLFNPQHDYTKRLLKAIPKYNFVKK